MSERDWTPTDRADAADDQRRREWWKLSTDHDTDQSFCGRCGEPCDSANVEAFEISGEAVCDDCAEEIFEDNGQFGAGA